MCRVRVQSFNKLCQNVTHFWNFKHAYPRHPGALQKNQIYNVISCSNKIVLSWLPRQPRPQNMPDVWSEYQLIILETILDYLHFHKSDSTFHVPVIHCRFSHIEPYYAKWQVAMGSSLIPSIPHQKGLCHLNIRPLHTSQSSYEFFFIKTYQLRRHTTDGFILL